LTSFVKKFGNPKTSLSCGLEWLSIDNLKKLKNNSRPGGEGEMIAIMKRKRDIMDYDPIEMITGAGLVFMSISSNGRITKFNPERHWIGGVVKGGHEADCLAQGKGWLIEKEF